MVAINKKHEKCNKPKCECCENPTEALRKQEELFDKFGWIIHMVANDDGSLNAHTHGLPEKYGHIDLQIALNMPPNVIGSVMHTIVDEIAAGRTFKEGEIADKIIKPPYKVTFVKRMECGREVLRVIIPDKDGNLEQDKQIPGYASQWIQKDE